MVLGTIGFGAYPVRVGLIQALGRMTELAVPSFMATILVTPIMIGLPILLIRMLSLREPEMYEQIGSPSLLKDRYLALAQLAIFLGSWKPEQLSDRSTYILANIFRIFVPLYICIAVPFLYQLFAWWLAA